MLPTDALGWIDRRLPNPGKSSVARRLATLLLKTVGMARIMKRISTQSSCWELLLGIALVAFQLCAWPTDHPQSRLLDHQRENNFRRAKAGSDTSQRGWQESATTTPFRSVSDHNLKPS